jgi:LuxR family maltose regulon positive regulatory protein
MLQSPQPPPVTAVLTSLINEIAVLPHRIILILDDYHLIDAPPIHDALSFLLENQPPHFHLVIATREDPPLPLSRLRGRGHLTELRAADLRFTSSEAAEFLNQVMGLDLSAENIALLEERTEGWIAGLQLAALAMQGHISMQGRDDADNFIKSFTGSNRMVLDYLIEEVLDRQPAEIQTFLLKTAVLNQLTGPLCNTLTNQNNGRVILENLEHTNLFIVPLDEERRWYRYHHLFADLLQQRLYQNHPDWIPELHRQASEWYEQNRFTDEAIEHALSAEDFERAAHLLEAYADTLWQQGQLAKLRHWLTKLPAELISTRPHLCIFYAWYLFAGGQQETAERILQAAERALDQSQAPPYKTGPDQPARVADTNNLRLKGRIATVRAFIATFQGDVPLIIQQAQQALAYLPEQDLTWRSSAAIALGDAHSFQGDLPAAYQARLAAAQACQAAGNIYFVMIANLKLAITLRSQGRLQPTIEICTQQMQLADEKGIAQSSAAGWCLAVWGEVLAELNDLDGALRQTQKGIELVERGSDLAMLGWSYICLVRVLFSRQELAEIEAIIQKMTQLTREADVPSWITTQMAIWQVRLWLQQGKYDLASQWAAERGLDTNSENKPLSNTDYYLLFEYTTLVRILLMLGRLAEATELLHQLFEQAKTGEVMTRMIEILILQALVLQAGGEMDTAVTTLEQALTLAEPCGFIRTFVDEGPSMARLLYQALSKGIAPDYVRQLLAAFPASEPEPTTPPQSDNSEFAWIEPLSDREIEVIQLIAAGLSNKEISSRLYLSPNTIKTHTRNIYSKLGVNSRIQAVARARDLEILSST